MSTREQALQIINTLTEDQLKLLINLVNSFKAFAPEGGSAKGSDANEKIEPK